MLQRKSKKNNCEPPYTELKKDFVWLKATYSFHTFVYRDPRSAFSSASGLPVVSPTAVLLGIVSTLFNIGKSAEALAFLAVIGTCSVVVDAPEGIVFFRAFHQIRRYHSDTKGQTARVGFTQINQGTREYGLVQGLITLFVQVPQAFIEPVILALRNRDHLGSHDSLCSLVGDVELCSEPQKVIYLTPEQWQTQIPEASCVTIVTLSRFKKEIQALEPTVGKHWWMAGGDETELAPFLIKGSFKGTSKGKIFQKCP